MKDSRPQPDDLLIGENRWITYVQHDWANIKWYYIDEIIQPLSSLLERLQIDCVAECCGLDAFSFFPEDILGVTPEFERESTAELLTVAIAAVEQLTANALGSKLLNNAIDRETMLELLRHIRETVKPDEHLNTGKTTA